MNAIKFTCTGILLVASGLSAAFAAPIPVPSCAYQPGSPISPQSKATNTPALQAAFKSAAAQCQAAGAPANVVTALKMWSMNTCKNTECKDQYASYVGLFKQWCGYSPRLPANPNYEQVQGVIQYAEGNCSGAEYNWLVGAKICMTPLQYNPSVTDQKNCVAKYGPGMRSIHSPVYSSTSK